MHTLIINVMKSYFTFNESLSSTFSPNPFSSQNTGYTGMRQNLRLSAIEVSIFNGICVCIIPNWCIILLLYACYISSALVSCTVLFIIGRVCWYY